MSSATENTTASVLGSLGPWPSVCGLVVVESAEQFALVVLSEALSTTVAQARWWPIAVLSGCPPSLLTCALAAKVPICPFTDWQSIRNTTHAKALLELWQTNSAIDTPLALARVLYFSAIYESVLRGRRYHSTNTGILVGIGRDLPLLAAAAHAVMLGVPLHLVETREQMARILSAFCDVPITVVCDSAAFDDPALCAIVTEHPGVIGCLIMTSWASLTQWLARIYLAPSSPSLPDVFISTSHFKSRNWGLLQIIDREEWTPEMIRSTVTSEHGMLLLHVHGMADRFYIGKCSIGGSDHEEQDDSHNGEIIDPAAIRAQHIFVDTCAGIRLDTHLTPHPVQVAFRILDEWAASYVSTTAVKDNSWQECLLFYALSRAGLPLGLAVAWVNYWLIQAQVDAPCYFLIGEPRVVLNSPPNYEWFIEDNGEGNWRLTFTDTQSPMVMAIIEHPLLFALAQARRLRVTISQPDTECYVVSLPRERRIAVVICRWAVNPGARIVLEMGEMTPLSHATEEICRHFPVRIRHLGWLKATGAGKVKGLSHQLEAEMNRAQRLLALCGTNGHGNQEIWKLDSRLREHVVVLQETIVEDLVNRAVSPAILTEVSREHFRVAEVRFGYPDCSCGSKCFEKLLEAPLDEQRGRLVTVCRACGIVANWPNPRPLELDFAAGLDGSDGTLHVTVTCAEPQVSPAVVTLACRLGSSLVPRSAYREAVSEIITASLPHAHPTSFHFALQYPPMLKERRCRLYLIALVNLELAILQRPLIC